MQTANADFPQILYHDSLEVGDLVDQQEETRASVWTGTLVSKISAMDRVSSNQFGKLELKQQYRGRDQGELIPPERVEEFIDSNMAGNNITQFGTHDCGLFTILAIQHWDGQRLPDIIGYNELKLRKMSCFRSSTTL
ncbi:unnamed protein product [Urochloa humidicola]